MKSLARLTVDGLSVAYLDRGPVESDEVIFLVHDGAYGTDAELAWDNVIPGLSASYRVVAPDLIGYGRSAKAVFFDQSPHETNIAMIGKLCEALDLGSKRVHFVGSSFGGGLVLIAAARRKPVWPMATGTTIGGTYGYARNKHVFAELGHYDQSMDDARRITQLLVSVQPQILTGHIEKRYANGLIPGHWETLNAHHLSGPAGKPQASQARESPTDFLRDCSVPLLFIEGREDRLLAPGWARRLAAVTPCGTAAEVPGAHCPNIDQPLRVANKVLEFVGASDRSEPDCL